MQHLVEAKPLPDRRDLVDEVGSEADVFDSHHLDRVVEVVEPARERRRVRIDDERERHHPENAPRSARPSSCQSARFRGWSRTRGSPRASPRRGPPRRGRRARSGRMHAQGRGRPRVRRTGGRALGPVGQSLRRRVDPSGELVRVVPGQTRVRTPRAYHSSNAPDRPRAARRPPSRTPTASVGRRGRRSCGPGRPFGVRLDDAPELRLLGEVRSRASVRRAPSLVQGDRSGRQRRLL